MVERFLDYLLHECNYSLKTINSYQKDLEKFERYCKEEDEQIEWKSVDPDIIRNWIVDLMEQGEKPTSVNRYLSALRTFYTYLMKREGLDYNPATKVRGPKKNKPLPVFLKEKENEVLMNRTMYPDDFVGLRDYTVICTFYETGIRLSELVGLNIGDVDFSANQIKVTGKRNKQRYIPFGKHLQDDLTNYIQERNRVCGTEESSLFVNSKGVRISHSSVWKLVHDNLSKVTSQKKKSPHVLRHTFATQILNHDGDLEAVKQLLGHESIATTEVYTHTTFEELKKVYKQAHPRS